MMTTQEKKRVQEIELTIKLLKKKIKKLEEERYQLLINNTNIIDILPVRARNAFTQLGIKNDIQLMQFLEGDDKYTELVSRYKYASSPKERLMRVRNIGNRVADEVINIVYKQ